MHFQLHLKIVLWLFPFRRAVVVLSDPTKFQRTFPTNEMANGAIPKKKETVHNFPLVAVVIVLFFLYFSLRLFGLSVFILRSKGHFISAFQHGLTTGKFALACFVHAMRI